MNNAIVHEVIAINNRCLESLHDGSIARALSELQVAMQLLKQRAVAAAVVNPVCRESHATELLQKSSSTATSFQPPPADTNNSGMKNNHQPYIHPQELPSTGVVGIMFCPNATHITSCLLSQTSKPISLCYHQLLLVADDNRYATTPSISANFRTNLSDTVSTEDVRLLCATLLYNMGLLCHRYAYICHRNSHPATSITANIIRASEIYELVIEFCEQRNVVTTRRQTHDICTNERMIHMIKMMACNNCAEVCYELGNYVKYKICMDVLQYHLILPSSFTNNHTDDTAGSGSDIIYNIIYIELKLNVLIYKLFPTAPTLASAA